MERKKNAHTPRTDLMPSRFESRLIKSIRIEFGTNLPHIFVLSHWACVCLMCVQFTSFSPLLCSGCSNSIDRKVVVFIFVAIFHVSPVRIISFHNLIMHFSTDSRTHTRIHGVLLATFLSLAFLSAPWYAGFNVFPSSITNHAANRAIHNFFFSSLSLPANIDQYDTSVISS